MVTRKPVPARSGDMPPYPTSPQAMAPAPLNFTAPQKNHVADNLENDNNDTLTRSRSSSVSSHNTWNSGFDSDREDDKLEAEPVGLPSSLRVGHPSPSVSANSSTAALHPQQQQQQFHSHNPYLNRQPEAHTPFGGENTQSLWDSPSPAPPNAPPPAPPLQLPTVTSPTDQFAGLSLHNQNDVEAENLEPPKIPQKSSRRSLSSQASSQPSFNPWQQDLDREQQTRQSASHTPDSQHLAPSAPPPFEQPAAEHSFAPPPALPPSPGPPLPPSGPPPPPQPYVSHSPAATEPFTPPPGPPPSFQSRASHSPAHESFLPPPGPPPALQSRTSHSPISESFAPPPGPPPIHGTFQPPPGPPPSHQATPLIDLGSEDAPSFTQPSQPPSIDVTSANRSIPPSAASESPSEQLKKQRNETYQIKHINWQDPSAGSNAPIRQSPILTQNANGPCPLLALVNALTLSTPDHLDTGLVDALRSREQISLGLLLDNVFEELTRRTEVSRKELPDIGDLYSFLITLHTGMNVNPRFVAPSVAQRGSLHVDPVNLGDMHPSHRQQAKPGTFEETREMLLYSTFDIPLIHGWVPPADSPVYAAFDRSAKTFDEALNIQFAEDDLEQKLRSQGLNSQEQQLFEDVTSVKQFLSNYPTQLTEYGLEIMSKSLKPGQIAILFRNDHFSTLYKEPRNGTLMTLVTDAGYSSHDEIVWESLVDVNGAASGLFSGDFRPVGNSSIPTASTSNVQSGSEEGWQTVPGRSNSRNAAAGVTSGASTDAAPHKTLEQEDADLALALQLQEEEEDNQRREQSERRRREDELSRQYLDRESSAPERRPQVPPRRSNLNRNASTTAPATTTFSPPASVPPPTADAPYLQPSEGADDEPPSYEQAASDRPFRPPGSHPRQRQGDALGALTALQLQNTAFAAPQNGSAPNSPGYPPNRRRSSGMGMGRRQPSQTHAQVQGQSPAAATAGRTSSGYYPGMAQAPVGSRVSDQERCVIM